MSHRRRQLTLFGGLLATNALLAFVAFALGLPQQFMAGSEIPERLASMPGWLLGLANAGFVLVLYGLLGLAGVWFARKLSLPGIYREGAGWRHWVVVPMAIGTALGVVLIVGDVLFAGASEEWAGFPHPEFPLSIIASATAGIGEEILFRLFAMGLWAFLLDLALRRWNARRLALWAGNVIVALAFGAAHLPATMMAIGVSTPAELPSIVIAEVFVLSGIAGIVAGQRYVKEGLIAAVGIHFWADVVWHIVWPAVHGG